MKRCIHPGCGSYAFNLQKENIDQGDLCDHHFWQRQAETAAAERDELKRLAKAHLKAMVKASNTGNALVNQIVGVARC